MGKRTASFVLAWSTGRTELKIGLGVDCVGDVLASEKVEIGLGGFGEDKELDPASVEVNWQADTNRPTSQKTFLK